ncbi:hypothetical protein AWV63_29290 [Micromonospora rifamycinica]|nr:hypothetical protein AWV63_29290 [Micromonospora rifamycinica]
MSAPAPVSAPAPAPTPAATPANGSRPVGGVDAPTVVQPVRVGGDTPPSTPADDRTRAGNEGGTGHQTRTEDGREQA